MTQTNRRNSYTFKEGLTMMAAKAVGIDPYLAAEAGEGAKAAINAIRHAAQTKNPKDRAVLIQQAQTELRSINAAQHPKVVNAFQSRLLALQGRGGDSEIAHLTPGEVVIPRALQTAELMRQIVSLAARQGIDARQLIVGGQKVSINPHTGAEEHAFWNDISNGIGRGFRSIFGISDASAEDAGPIARGLDAQRVDPKDLNASDAIKNFIMKQEGDGGGGCYPSPEKDGTQTCGWGHKLKPGEEWDSSKVNEVRNQDIVAAEDRVRRLAKVPLYQNEFDSLVSHAYSSRETPDPSRPKSVGWTNSDMLTKLNQGNYPGAFDEMLDWTGGLGTKLGGLVKRRSLENRWGKVGPVENY